SLHDALPICLRHLSLDHRRGEVARADLEARALRRRPGRLAASAQNRPFRLRELTPSPRAGHGEPPTLSLEPPLHHLARAELSMKRFIPSLLALSLTLPCVIASAADELLVGNKSDDTVWRISLQDGRKLGEIASGAGPHEI